MFILGCKILAGITVLHPAGSKTLWDPGQAGGGYITLVIPALWKLRQDQDSLGYIERLYLLDLCHIDTS